MNRHLSRVIIMQSLYEWDFRPNNDIDEIKQRNIDNYDEDADIDFINYTIKGVIDNMQEADELITKAAPEWPLEQISSIDKTILRIAAYELLHSDEVPPKVAINEAVELGKTFGSENSSKFINGVLGTIYRNSSRYNPEEDVKVKSAIEALKEIQPGENDANNLEELEKKINVQFKNKDLLKQVFVHRSYLNENPGFGLEHNERLEFLGDAVLELVVTEYLFRKLPNPEGELTNLRSALVRGKMLSDIANSLEMDNYLYLSRGEAKSNGKSRQLILANAFEALIGGIYLDQGYDAAADLIQRLILTRLNNVIENKLYLDPKSHLQELAQAELSQTPTYKVMSESGPDHAKVFITGCFVGDKQIGEGSGSSKQAAESAAAENALLHWPEIIEDLTGKMS